MQRCALIHEERRPCRALLLVAVLLASAWPAAASADQACDFGDPVVCPARCAAGNVDSCYLQARAISSGIGVPQDSALATRTFKALCERGHPDSCNAHALDLQGEDESDDAVRRALPTYEKACTLGSSKGCNNLGAFLRRESFGRGAESLPTFVRSCDLGAASAATGCMTAALVLKNGEFGVAPDLPRAAALFQRACALGTEAGCASATALGLPSSITPTEASIHRDLLCRRGDLRACFSHAMALTTGKAVGRDPVAAARLFGIACAGDVEAPRACDQLAALHLDGSLGKVDVAAAIEPLRRGCVLVPMPGVMNTPRATSCRRLGDLTVMGQGVSADRNKAIELYERACRIKPPSGCQQAGSLKALDPSAPAHATAQLLFAEGCAGGDEESCRALDRAGLARTLRAAATATQSAAIDESCSKGGGQACFQRAVALEREGFRKDARPLHDLACRAGFARGCTALGAYLEEGLGGPVDLDGGLEALARACVLGHDAACKPAWARSKSRRAYTAAGRQRAQTILDDGCASGVSTACAP